jgi:histidine ammonia-lyase
MVKIGGKMSGLADIRQIVFEQQQVDLTMDALKAVDGCYKFLKDFSKNKLIYGINTGFGPMAQYKIDDADRKQLQFNLIRSHASGTGRLLEPMHTKAMMVARLNTLMRAHSGIHQDVVVLLKDLINKEVYPCIFQHGGVGASGDLVQLAHLALVLIGEGEVVYEGKRQSTAKVFKKLDIKPLEMHIREGLAILNGTSAMTGVGLVNLLQAYQLLSWEIIMSAMINELVEAYDDSFSKELNQVKLHDGQNQIAAAMRKVMKGSKLMKKRHEHLYEKEVTERVLEDKVQEYYSLRCTPQIMGPVLDTLRFAEKVLVEEFNSVNDNPIIDPAANNIFHGGNFHGDYVSLEMDKVKIAITKLSMLAERQLNYLLNHNLNRMLPPFVNLGVLGLNFGMQGVQYTATSTVAENQMLSNPMYVHSIPNNNDNQDIVSMGCNSALICHKVIENAFEVMAVHLMTIVQAIDYREVAHRLSPMGKEVYDKVRAVFPKFIGDDPRYVDLQNVKELIIANRYNFFE